MTSLCCRQRQGQATNPNILEHIVEAQQPDESDLEYVYVEGRSRPASPSPSRFHVPESGTHHHYTPPTSSRIPHASGDQPWGPEPQFWHMYGDDDPICDEDGELIGSFHNEENSPGDWWKERESIPAYTGMFRFIGLR